MHRVFFSLKRVHLRIVEVSKQLLRGFELTPARFDMMRIVLVHSPLGVSQTRIRALLGVSATTVSRMLVSLERLGFVLRTAWYRDSRRLIVTLTPLGEDRVTAAMKALVGAGAAEPTTAEGATAEPDATTAERGAASDVNMTEGDVATTDADGGASRVAAHAAAKARAISRAERLARRGVDIDADAAVPRLRTLQRGLASMRRVFGDQAAFVDPWRTDSLEPYYFTTIVDGRVVYGADIAVHKVRYGDEYDVAV